MKKPPYSRHLNSSADLETTYEATRAGFVSLALEKNDRATLHVDDARTLQEAASQAQKVSELMGIESIQKGLLTAAGISDKAAVYLQTEDKEQAIKQLIKKFLKPAKDKFVEELVFRFLLTRGDTLGGSMRNIGGMLAQKRFTRAIFSTLRIAGIPHHWQDNKFRMWQERDENNNDVLSVRGIYWEYKRKTRILIFNLTVPIIKNNVDICFFNATPSTLDETNPKTYLALGELKGGIDPAGADEHWKTARTSLDRIRKSFTKVNLTPHTFFVGAAIQEKMAGEIWRDLTSGVLSNAANLNEDDQVVSISHWLCNL